MNLQDVLIQADEVRLGKDEIQVLKRLSEPVTFHSVGFFRAQVTDVLDGRVTKIGMRHLLNVLEHAPSRILQGLVTSDSVHYENRLNGLRSKFGLVFSQCH